MDNPLDDFLPTAKEALSHKLKTFLKEKSGGEKVSTFTTCEPVALEDFLADPGYPIIVSFRVKSKEPPYDETFPAEVVGVAGFSDGDTDLATARAGMIAIQYLGAPGSSCVTVVYADNPTYLRRKAIAKIYPEALESFPKLHETFESLQVVAWNERAIKQAKSWVSTIDENLGLGKGLSLRHPMTGSGKTSLLAVATLEAVRRRGVSAYYAFVPDLVDLDFGAKRNQIIECCRETEILLLDDVDARVRRSASGDEDASKSRSTILGIVNLRYNKRKPVIWTSNTATVEKLLEHVGERILRRITEPGRNELLAFDEGAWDWGSRK